MRVIFLSPHSDPQARLGEPDAGGQCIYEHELALTLAKNGIQVVTFCRQRNHHEPITRVIPGYTIYRITAGGDRFLPKENMWAVLPEFTSKVANILATKRLYKDSVIHAHYWDGAAAALLLKANYHDLPYIWTPHSLGFVKREKYHGLVNETSYHFIPRLLWESYGTMSSNHLITLSRNEKRKLIQHYGANPERITVAPPGVTIGTPTSMDKYRALWHLSPNDSVLLCIGRMSKNKGYHHAIRIASVLKNKGINNFKLVIVGGSSNLASVEEKQYQSYLRKLAKILGNGDHIIFQPSVDHNEIQSIYTLADIYLMTSENEPFGLTAVEAMMMGKTVIAHNRGGTRDVIKNGITGFLTDIHDYRRTAELIGKLLKRKGRLQKVGERASASVHSKYSWESRLPLYLKVYENAKNIFPTRLKKMLSYDHFLAESLKIV